MTDNMNTPAQIAAVERELRGVYRNEDTLEHLDRVKLYFTSHEKKLFVAMSDLSKLHRRIDIDPLSASIVATMATRTYRVQVHTDGRVSISSWGLAIDVEDTYDSVDELPAWMQRKIATLMIFDPEKANEEVKGLGRRISKGTFWLYPDEGEDDGDDTRAPCEGTGT
jgi:hypothetical protein